MIKKATTWEVVPSISLEAGKAVAELLGTSDFVVDVDVAAAEEALVDLQDKRAKPGVVHFCVEKFIEEINPHDTKKAALGTAEYNDKDKSSTVKVALFAKSEPEPIPLTPVRLQNASIHELKHAADNTVKSLRRADRKFYEKAVQKVESKIKLAFRETDATIASAIQQGEQFEENAMFSEEALLINEALAEFERKMSKETPLELRAQGIDPSLYDQVVTIVQ